jgi:hypothetical protein
MHPRDYVTYDKARPEAWRAFQAMAIELIRRGRKCYSARDIFAKMRWDNTEPGANYVPVPPNAMSVYYARKFHALWPEHAGFFAVADSKLDGTIFPAPVVTKDPDA